MKNDVLSKSIPIFYKNAPPAPQKEHCDFTKNKVGHDLDMKFVSALDFLHYSHDLFLEKPKNKPAVMPVFHFFHHFDMILPK